MFAVALRSAAARSPSTLWPMTAAMVFATMTVMNTTISSTNTTNNHGASAAHRWNRKRYWAATGPFLAMFVGSAALTVLDPDGTRRGAATLGFPAFLVMYPLAFAKLAAVGAILFRKWPTLTTFAFAGLLYDLVLALAAHIRNHDFPAGWLAVAGLVLWAAAYWVERDRVQAEAVG